MKAQRALSEVRRAGATEARRALRVKGREYAVVAVDGGESPGFEVLYGVSPPPEGEETR